MGQFPKEKENRRSPLNTYMFRTTALEESIWPSTMRTRW